MQRLFTGKNLATLILPLIIELLLTLFVGMIDSVMSTALYPLYASVGYVSTSKACKSCAYAG